MATKFNHLAVIPFSVLGLKIPDGAKLLYGVLSSATDIDGNCFVTNSEITEVFNISTRNVSRWIDELQKVSLIQITNIGGKRCINGIDKNVHPDKNVYGQKCPTPTKMSMDRNVHPRQKCPPIIKDNQTVSNQNTRITQKSPSLSIESNNSSIITTRERPKIEKKSSIGTASVLFSSTKYVTEPNGVLLFEQDLIARNPDFEMVDAIWYYERCRNWSDEGQKTKVNWIATAANWIMSDKQVNKLKIKSNNQINNHGTIDTERVQRVAAKLKAKRLAAETNNS